MLFVCLFRHTVLHAQDDYRPEAIHSARVLVGLQEVCDAVAQPTKRLQSVVEATVVRLVSAVVQVQG